jgi:hypothetical protein
MDETTTKLSPAARFRFSLRALLVFIGVLAVLGAAITPLYKLNQRLGVEYTTAAVIRDTIDFVELHNGQWPMSWDDLPNGEHASRFVRMRFDITIDELIHDPKLIHSAIVPVTGEYHVYPHQEMQLNELRKVLIQHHRKTSSNQPAMATM